MKPAKVFGRLPGSSPPSCLNPPSPVFRLVSSVIAQISRAKDPSVSTRRSTDSLRKAFSLPLTLTPRTTSAYPFTPPPPPPLCGKEPRKDPASEDLLRQEPTFFKDFQVSHQVPPDPATRPDLYVVAGTAGKQKKTGGEDGSAGSKDHPRDGEPNKHARFRVIVLPTPRSDDDQNAKAHHIGAREYHGEVKDGRFASAGSFKQVKWIMTSIGSRTGSIQALANLQTQGQLLPPPLPFASIHTFYAGRSNAPKGFVIRPFVGGAIYIDGSAGAVFVQVQRHPIKVGKLIKWNHVGEIRLQVSPLALRFSHWLLRETFGKVKQVTQSFEKVEGEENKIQVFDEVFVKVKQGTQCVEKVEEEMKKALCFQEIRVGSKLGQEGKAVVARVQLVGINRILCSGIQVGTARFPFPGGEKKKAFSFQKIQAASEVGQERTALVVRVQIVGNNGILCSGIQVGTARFSIPSTSVVQLSALRPLPGKSKAIEEASRFGAELGTNQFYVPSETSGQGTGEGNQVKEDVGDDQTDEKQYTIQHIQRSKRGPADADPGVKALPGPSETSGKGTEGGSKVEEQGQDHNDEDQATFEAIGRLKRGAGETAKEGELGEENKVKEEGGSGTDEEPTTVKAEHHSNREAGNAAKLGRVQVAREKLALAQSFADLKSLAKDEDSEVSWDPEVFAKSAIEQERARRMVLQAARELEFEELSQKAEEETGLSDAGGESSAGEVGRVGGGEDGDGEEEGVQEKGMVEVGLGAFATAIRNSDGVGKPGSVAAFDSDPLVSGTVTVSLQGRRQAPGAEPRRGQRSLQNELAEQKGQATLRGSKMSQAEREAEDRKRDMLMDRLMEFDFQRKAKRGHSVGEREYAGRDDGPRTAWKRPSHRSHPETTGQVKNEKRHSTMIIEERLKKATEALGEAFPELPSLQPPRPPPGRTFTNHCYIIEVAGLEAEHA